MPREEDLPPSKRGALNDEITKETKRFYDFIGSDNDEKMFSLMTDKQKINWVITYINRQNAVYHLEISSLKDEIQKLKDEIHKE